MSLRVEIYTTVLKRALKYINGEQKKKLTSLFIKEYMDNHLHAEPLDLDSFFPDIFEGRQNGEN